MVDPVVDTERAQSAAAARIVQQAHDCMETCNWRLGDLAAQWKQQTGRTDEEFGLAIGLSKQQVQARRAVWERFGDSTELDDLRSRLTWSHFREAVAWDDAIVALDWAAACEATVAEMRTWYRIQHGESPFQPQHDILQPDTFDDGKPIAAADVVTGQNPEDVAGMPHSETTDSAESPQPVTERQAAEAAAADDGTDYAPFRASASEKPVRDDEAQPAVAKSRSQPTAEEQLLEALRRMDIERVLDLLEKAFDRDQLVDALDRRLQQSHGRTE